jgi:hypothetical protein
MATTDGYLRCSWCGQTTPPTRQEGWHRALVAPCVVDPAVPPVLRLWTMCPLCLADADLQTKRSGILADADPQPDVWLLRK